MRERIKKTKRFMEKKFRAVQRNYHMLYNRNFSLEAKISNDAINYDFNDFEIKKREKDSSILHLIFAGKINLNESSDKLKYIQPVLNEAEYTFCSVDNDIENVNFEKFTFDYYINDNILTKNTTSETNVIDFNGKKIGLVSFKIKESIEDIEKKIKKVKENTDFLIVFYNYTFFSGRKVENLAELEVDYIIGVSHSKNYKLQYFIKDRTSIVRTLGILTSRKFKNYLYRDSMLLNMRLQINENEVKMIEDSYIPIFNGKKVNQEKNIPLPIKMGEYNKEVNKALDYSRRRIGSKIINLFEEGRYLDVRTVFDILDFEVPENCRSILSERVRKICTSVGQTVENSILFIRPYDGNVYEFTEEEHIEKIQEIIFKAEDRGTLLIFTPYHFSDKIPEIIVENPLEYHNIVMHHIVNSLNMKIKIGVTGSVGKTTTKELIYNVLKYKYVTERSMHNSNTVKIGLHLQRIRPNTEAFVQELGGGKIGRAEDNAKMLGLTSGVVTNIENAHLRMSGSREQLLINKTNIRKGMKNEGPLFINIDNDMLNKFKNKKGVVTYSLLNKNADYYAENIVYTATQSIFFVCRNEVKTKVAINLLGEHNVLDAIAAFGIAEYENVPVKLIVRGLLDFQPEGIRQNIVEIANKTLYVDCFNSNFASLKASTEHLIQLAKNKRKILVFSDYTGLEDENEQSHIDSGNYLAHSEYDLFILYGKDVKIVYDILKEHEKNVFYSNDSKEICNYLQTNMKQNDFILFKGSSKFELERTIIDEVFGTSLSFARSLSKGAKRVFIDDCNQKFIITNIFAFINKQSNIQINNNTLIIPNEVEGFPVRFIRNKSFINNNNIERIVSSHNLKSICEKAFKNCLNLKSVKLASDFKILYRESFGNCKNLVDVDLGKSIIHIDEYVFHNCKSLKRIYLPSSVQYISNNAFDECNSELTIICEKNSYAHNWAIDNKKLTRFTNVIEAKVGNINLFDYIFDKSKVKNIISYNANVAFVLQTGEIYGCSEGEVRIEAILTDGSSIKTNMYVEKRNDDVKIPVLFNRYNGIGDEFEIEDLVEVGSEYRSNKPVYLNNKALDQFIKMHDDLKSENIDVVITHGYRDKNAQEEIFNRFVKSHGMEYANKRVAKFGFSQHNLGFAIDIHTKDGKNLEELYQWIENNCYKYGYCLKNLKGKEHITGTMYEPWHLYFIDDIEIAKVLTDRKITLEEYILENF